jgi:hypothetical protein
LELYFVSNNTSSSGRLLFFTMFLETLLYIAYTCGSFCSKEVAIDNEGYLTIITIGLIIKKNITKTNTA